MSNELILINNNDMDVYCLIVGCGVFLTLSVYYLIIKEYTSVPVTNMEPITHEEMETIFDEDRNITSVSNANIDEFITDSDFDTDTDVESDYQMSSDNDSDTESEHILDDPDLFFMPNVDFDICPIEELKFFEFNSLYQREIMEHGISDEEIMEFISWYSKEDLATN